jgi:hypothetical protein
MLVLRMAQWCSSGIEKRSKRDHVRDERRKWVFCGTGFSRFLDDLMIMIGGSGVGRLVEIGKR